MKELSLFQRTKQFRGKLNQLTGHLDQNNKFEENSLLLLYLDQAVFPKPIFIFVSIVNLIILLVFK